MSPKKTKNYNKKKLKQMPVRTYFSIQVQDLSPNGTRKTMEERICERDEFEV